MVPRFTLVYDSCRRVVNGRPVFYCLLLIVVWAGFSYWEELPWRL